jgi:hypothetical protein
MNNVATMPTASAATFGAWWHPRLAGTPPELRDRLVAIVPASLADAPLADAVTQLQHIAVQRLQRVLADAGATRDEAHDAAAPDVALELLTVDALVTYLAEAAASLGLALDAWSAQMMHQLASVSLPPRTT